MSLVKSLTLAGVNYDIESLSSEAQVQVANIEGADREIMRLQVQMALAQTARNAYVAALSTEIASSNTPPNPVVEPKKPRKTRSKV